MARLWLDDATVNRGARALMSAGALLMAAQLVHLDQSNPPVQSDLKAPPAVENALRRACYDCHSNQTRWPWYGRVAPLSWWVRYDIYEARRRLNFSEWGDYASDPGTEDRKLEQMARLMANSKMAPWYYRAIHPEARLNASDRAAITRWIAGEKIRLSSPNSNAAERGPE